MTLQELLDLFLAIPGMLQAGELDEIAFLLLAGIHGFEKIAKSVGCAGPVAIQRCNCSTFPGYDGVRVNEKVGYIILNGILCAAGWTTHRTRLEIQGDLLAGEATQQLGHPLSHFAQDVPRLSSGILAMRDA